MSKIVFILMSFLSLNSMANDPLKACLNYTFSSGKEVCFNLLKDDYFQEEVAILCSRLTFDSDKTECLLSIKSKVYTPTNIDICFNKSFSSNKIECLSNSGRKIDDAEELLTRIANIAKSTRLAIFEGNYFLL